MTINTILANYLTGEPLQDAVIIAVVMATLLEFIKIMFSSVFTMFRRN